jgi:hypothetical protein
VALSHPVFGGDFEARVCLVEGGVSAYGTCEEVFKGVAGPWGTVGVRVWVSYCACREGDLGIESETLRKHVWQTEADEGRRKDVLSGQEREEIKSPAP